MKPGILALVPDTWGGPPMPRQQILIRLAERMPVVWLDPAAPWREHLPRPRPIRADQRNAYGLDPPEDFHLYRPSRWLGEFFRPTWLADRIHRARIARAVSILRKEGCTKLVLYLWRPEFAYALDEGPWDLTLYHLDDEYSFSDTHSGIADQEMRLLQEVDQVLIHSSGIFERKGGINPRTELIPNGVDFETFAAPRTEPIDLARIPRPRVGYVGIIKRQLDLDLTLDLSKRHPEWSFVMVGPVNRYHPIEDVVGKLRERPNVHLLGPKRVDELPAYLQHLDAGMLCYRQNDYTDCIYPLKLHEYLAAGLPTVSTPIRTVREHRDVVSLASGLDEWSRALESAIAPGAGKPDLAERGREVARQHDWGPIVSRIHDLVAERLGSEVGPLRETPGPEGAMAASELVHAAPASPRLTIGLPVYNGERFLEQTVFSLLQQTFGDFALIIGDNASSDRTEEIAREIVNSDRRVRYVRNERNIGLAANYNALFRLASSELFKWAPADDAYLPDYLERCVTALDRDARAVLSYCRAQFVDSAGSPLEIEDPGWDLRHEHAAPRLLYAIHADHWVNSIIGVVRRDALHRTRLMPRYAGGDYVLLGELSLLGTFIEVPEPLLLRRIHPEASSQIRGDPEKIRVHVKGPGRGPSWPTWERTYGHLATIARSHLGWGARALLLKGLVRATLNRRPILRQELMAMLQWLFRSGARSRAV